MKNNKNFLFIFFFRRRSLIDIKINKYVQHSIKTKIKQWLQELLYLVSCNTRITNFI